MFQIHHFIYIHTPPRKEQNYSCKTFLQTDTYLTVTILKAIARQFNKKFPRDGPKPILLTLVFFPLYKTKCGREQESGFILR